MHLLKLLVATTLKLVYLGKNSFSEGADTFEITWSCLTHSQRDWESDRESAQNFQFGYHTVPAYLKRLRQPVNNKVNDEVYEALVLLQQGTRFNAMLSLKDFQIFLSLRTTYRSTTAHLDDHIGQIYNMQSCVSQVRIHGCGMRVTNLISVALPVF